MIGGAALGLSEGGAGLVACGVICLCAGLVLILRWHTKRGERQAREREALLSPFARQERDAAAARAAQERDAAAARAAWEEGAAARLEKWQQQQARSAERRALGDSAC